MARIDKGALTKTEIVTEATKQFLEKGYSNTSLSSIAKALSMSPGNLTFHYPTKEHLLVVMVEMLLDYQWKLMQDKAKKGLSMIMATCLETAAMICASEKDEITKDFFLSAYSSPMCLDLMRKTHASRAREIFGTYRPDWTEESFAEAEILVSGIKYATLMTAGDPVSTEARITGALDNILRIYGLSKELRQEKLKKVFATDRQDLSKRVLEGFKAFVIDTNDQTFRALLRR